MGPMCQSWGKMMLPASWTRSTYAVVPKQYLPTVDLTVKSSGANGNQGFSLGYGCWKQLRGIPWNFLHICIAYVLTGACGRISRRSEPYIELINTRSRSKISTCCC